jgi:hypothetical protein
MAVRHLLMVQQRWREGDGCGSMQMVRTVSCSSALQGRHLQDCGSATLLSRCMQQLALCWWGLCRCEQWQALQTIDALLMLPFSSCLYELPGTNSCRWSSIGFPGCFIVLDSLV